MRCFQPTRRSVIYSTILAFGVVFLVSATSSQAQISPNYGRPSPLERDMRFRDWSLERLKKQRAMTPAEQKIAYELVQKDFVDLQVLNNDLIKARAGGEILDYVLISQKTLEIHKIAARLQSNLKFPEEKETEAKQASSGSSDVNLSAVLMILDTVIYKFVKNPMFKNVDVIDVKDAVTAKDDLGRIIFLSERARKKSESLKK